jgi:hypothetical protein
MMPENAESPTATNMGAAIKERVKNTTPMTIVITMPQPPRYPCVQTRLAFRYYFLFKSTEAASRVKMIIRKKPTGTAE